MRTKDLVVGQDYALASSRYEKELPTRARVVRVGVHGLVEGDVWTGSRVSEHPVFVEYEVIPSPGRGRGVSFRHECRVDAKNPGGKPYLAPRYLAGQKDHGAPKRTIKVLRALPAAFWRPWDEYAAETEEKQRREAAVDAVHKAEDARMERALAVLAEHLGIRAWGTGRLTNGTLLAKIGLEDMERIARAIDGEGAA